MRPEHGLIYLAGCVPLPWKLNTRWQQKWWAITVWPDAWQQLHAQVSYCRIEAMECHKRANNKPGTYYKGGRKRNYWLKGTKGDPFFFHFRETNYLTHVLNIKSIKQKWNQIWVSKMQNAVQTEPRAPAAVSEGREALCFRTNREFWVLFKAPIQIRSLQRPHFIAHFHKNFLEPFLKVDS